MGIGEMGIGLSRRHSLLVGLRLAHILHFVTEKKAPG